MKKSILLLCLASFFFGYSQENETTDLKKNELKGNALMLVAGAFEITYERLLNDESGAGLSLFLSYDEDVYTKFSLTPYYRFYFGKKAASGFFAEGFGMLNTYQGENYYYNDGITITVKEEKITDFALGFGLGGKWVNKKGFVFELNAGIGRNLFNDKSSDYDQEIVGRGGITLGYRF
jgi:hypothetical protein